MIENVALSIPEVIAYLKQHRHLIQDLVKVNNLDASVRKDLNTLLEKLNSEKPIIPQSLLYRHPNYNPMNIVEMKKFVDRLVAEKIEASFHVPLIALRELYLEMTPLSDGTSQCRIGGVPLELDKLGDTPSSGEISAEILEYITLRVKLKEEYEQGRRRWKEEMIAKINSLNECQKVFKDGEDCETTDQGSCSSIKTEDDDSKKNQTCDDGVSSIHSNGIEMNIIHDTSGDIQCSFGLKCQFNPEYSNISKALYWYTKAAEQGQVLALRILRYCHQEGLGVEKNERIAEEFRDKFLEYLKKHKCAIEKNEYRENDLSFKLLEQMTNQQQNQLLQYLSGICFHYGLGVTKCMKTAVERYRLSAEKGNTTAQNMLGVSYYNGEGVELNYEEAVKWYRLAAEKGNADAQNGLGDCYRNGQGVELNYEEALRWYRLATKQRNTTAQNNLGHCYHTGQGVDQNYAEAVKWYRMAAGQGNEQAQCNLGNCYRWGYGVELNYEEAAKWYRLAAEKGNADAQNRLGDCYYDGQGVEQNYEEAMKWFREAAEGGHSAARYKLGTCQRMINKQKKTRTQKREDCSEEDNDRNNTCKKPRL